MKPLVKLHVGFMVSKMDTAPSEILLICAGTAIVSTCSPYVLGKLYPVGILIKAGIMPVGLRYKFFIAIVIDDRFII
jgi:hypothetical protein